MTIKTLTPPPVAYRIRPARRGDAPSMVAVLAEAGGKGDVATVTWIISHPEMEVLVAADQFDKVIGFVTFSHRPWLSVGGRSGTIDELVVSVPWRRRGAGRELMKRVIERAKVLMVKELQIQSAKKPDEGLTAFFQKVGFELAESGVFRMR